MSDYKPITGELRDAMCKWGWVERDGSIMFTTSPIPTSIDAEQSLVISGSDFDRLCDEIDAIHTQLERENAELKAELEMNRVLREQKDRDGWVRLPVADGEPIRIGDMMERMERRGEVIALVLADNPWGDGNHWAIQLEGEHAPTVFDSLFHHYVPDTWERIISDAIRASESDELGSGSYEQAVTALVARCKALAGEAS